MGKPGVMLYFDQLDMLGQLTDEQAGQLFKGIMDYGKTRTDPQLPYPMCIFWPLIQHRIDSDDTRYRSLQDKNRYAIYVRWARERGEEPKSFEVWLSQLFREEDIKV